MRVQRNGKEYKWTWQEYYQEAIKFSKSMHVVGITERKAVNIIGFNSPEWAISFFGAISYNCVVSGVYITNGPEACVYQADHSEAELIVADSMDQVKKYTSNFHKLPNLKAIVVYNVDKLPEDLKDKRIYLWKDFLKIGL